MSRTALIGHSGFVGGTLMRQRDFSDLYRSTNIADIRGESFDLVVCCGMPAKKWLANKDPEGDRASIDSLIGHLETLSARRFVLVSTVDVFSDPHGVDEATPVRTDGLHPYGKHRRMVEEFVAARFPQSLVVRLPGLVGPGLKKNVLFDLHNTRLLEQIDARATFQFYPMVRLWQDISTALEHQLDLVHLTAEPVAVSEFDRSVFGIETHPAQGTAPNYDMRTRHAELFGGLEHYTYSKRESLLAISAYHQSERTTLGEDASQ